MVPISQNHLMSHLLYLVVGFSGPQWVSVGTSGHWQTIILGQWAWVGSSRPQWAWVGNLVHAYIFDMPCPPREWKDWCDFTISSFPLYWIAHCKNIDWWWLIRDLKLILHEENKKLCRILDNYFQLNDISSTQNYRHTSGVKSPRPNNQFVWNTFKKLIGWSIFTSFKNTRNFFKL